MASDNKDMSFLDHLEVFRWHLIRSAIAILFCSILSFAYKSVVFDMIILAPMDPNFLTYRVLCEISRYIGIQDTLCFIDSPFNLINTSMSGQFSAHITTSIFSGLILSFPYVFWEFWRFIRPALYRNETKIARGLVFFSSSLFLFGVLFGYFIITPLSVNFLGSYQVGEDVDNLISLGSFISTVTTVSFANGIIFELPIVVYFLTKAGFLTPDFMRIYRKHSMIIILILSSIITPPDVISQILVSLPLIVLYEFSIKLSERVIKNQQKALHDS